MSHTLHGIVIPALNAGTGVPQSPQKLLSERMFPPHFEQNENRTVRGIGSDIITKRV
jgi:hypothetical protein